MTMDIVGLVRNSRPHYWKRGERGRMGHRRLVQFMREALAHGQLTACMEPIQDTLYC